MHIKRYKRYKSHSQCYIRTHWLTLQIVVTWHCMDDSTTAVSVCANS